MLRSYVLSDAGRVRKNNQDCCAIEEDLGLFVVADGMGGHSAGEVASRLAVEAIVGFVRRTHDTEEVSWPYGIDSTLSYEGNRLRTAIHLANRRVFRAAESRDDYTGMGTTVVSTLVSTAGAVVAHVGDSRLYVLRPGGELEQATRDDTWLATMLAGDPAADPAALERNPMRHVLTNVLGAWENTDVHLRELPIRGDERFLLCSDGLHGVVPPGTIRCLLDDDDVERAAHRLVEEALNQGSRDNISVIVVSCEGYRR